jgi:hypothetical protein
MGPLMKGCVRLMGLSAVPVDGFPNEYSIINGNLCHPDRTPDLLSTRPPIIIILLQSLILLINNRGGTVSQGLVIQLHM